MGLSGAESSRMPSPLLLASTTSTEEPSSTEYLALSKPNVTQLMSAAKTAPALSPLSTLSVLGAPTAAMSPDTAAPMPYASWRCAMNGRISACSTKVPMTSPGCVSRVNMCATPRSLGGIGLNSSTSV